MNQHPDTIADTLQTVVTQGFSAQPVERSVLEEILYVARRAPSGVNTQPWNVWVLQGDKRAALEAAVAEAVPALVDDAGRRAAFWQRFDTHPGSADWHAQDVAHAGDAWLSAAMDRIAGEPGRAQAELARYFRFFDAPVGLVFTIHRDLGVGSLLDYGMFLQNITLAARARGLRAVLQTGWRGCADTVLGHVEAPPEMLLVAGMALGYTDTAQPPIAALSAVPSVESFTTWHA